MRNVYRLVVLGATVVACRGTNSDANDAGQVVANPFVGQWTCPYTTNSGYMGTTPMQFTAHPDGTLSSTSLLQITPCSLQWTVSGSTATAASGQSCGTGAGSFTVTSYTFIVNGNTATFDATAIEHGVTDGPDGGTVPVDIAGSLSGTCTRDGSSDAAVGGDAAGNADGAIRDSNGFDVDLTGPACPNGQLTLRQAEPPTYASTACAQCIGDCVSACHAMCQTYYQCYCGCAGQTCQNNCYIAASQPCRDCVDGYGLTYACDSPTCTSLCCAPSGFSCGTQTNCCSGTCNAGSCT